MSHREKNDEIHKIFTQLPSQEKLIDGMEHKNDLHDFNNFNIKYCKQLCHYDLIVGNYFVIK